MQSYFSLINCFDGEWIYYNDTDRIYRLKVDGSKKTEIYKAHFVRIKYLKLIDGVLYFTEGDMFSSISPDGSKYRTYFKNENLWSQKIEFTKSGDFIYLRGRKDIFQINLSSGKNEFLTSEVNQFVVNDGCIYYTNIIPEEDWDKPGESGKLLKAYEQKDNNSVTVEVLADKCSHIVDCRNGWVYYYINDDSEDGLNNKLFRVRIDGTNCEKICDYFDSAAFHEDNIYILNIAYDEERQIIVSKVNINTLEKETILEVSM